MFLFLIPRTPVRYRNPVREELWLLCKKALLDQTSKDWKAIVIGDTKEDDLDPNHFLNIELDDCAKIAKLTKALSFIDSWEIKPEYLIRLDDDDIFSTVFLSLVQNLPLKYDCYFDISHACIDLVYLKASNNKNTWMPNTVIHKYKYALEKCGKNNTPLILQNHDEYWHIFYADKKVFSNSRNYPIYYRILTPFSITGSAGSQEKGFNWKEHINYLNGYGPWTDLPSKFYYHKNLKEISSKYFVDRPHVSILYWMFNKIKFVKNLLFRW